MSRSSIAIDLDDVLANHVEAFIEFSNSRYNTNLDMNSYSEWWGDFWDVDYEEILRRAKEFHISVNHTFEVRRESLPALKKLGKDYDLYLVTARPKYMNEPTKKWANEYFPGIFKEVHLVPVWEIRSKITKAEICQQIGASFLVDDSVKHCNLAAEGGIKCVLFGDYPWNKSKKINKNVTLCKDWGEVLAYFDDQSPSK